MPRSAQRPKNFVVEKEISSWKNYLEIVTSPSYKNWAFRGHSEVKWQLWPTISREFKNRRILRKHWLGQEYRILRIFQRKAFHFLPDVPPVGDTPRWLALMQHHGAPTRMLDFTWSPWVAAFFALEPATKDAAVWAINTRELETYGFGPYPEPYSRPRKPKEWLKEYGFDRDGVTVGEPYFMNKRLIAQSGTLVIPHDITRPINSILGKRKDLVVKFILSGPEIRDKGLEELYTMNLTYATLFPDLDGLSRSLAYELEYHWGFDPKT
ncbi:FRG domain-containing protein [Planctomycetota bacterium]